MTICPISAENLSFWQKLRRTTVVMAVVVEEMWGIDVYVAGEDSRHKTSEFKFIIQIPEYKELEKLCQS